MTTELVTQNELFTALAKAQGQFKTVAASRHVNIKMKDGGSYSYNYATLAAIMDMLRGPLTSNGLSIAQLIVGDELITILGHSSGQSITSTVALPKSGDIKGMGANLTYLRRYSITAITGVAIDEEDDERGADGKVELKSQRPKPVSDSPAPSVATEDGSTKPNGNGGSKQPDPMTRYWSEVKSAGLAREKGAEILAQAGNDPSRAVDVLLGMAQS